MLISIDPRQASHTAVVIDDAAHERARIQVREDRSLIAAFLEFADSYRPRRWAIESAGGLGCLLAQQLVRAGEDVVAIVPPAVMRGGSAAMLILAYVAWAALLASFGHTARIVDVDFLNSREPPCDPWEEAQRLAQRRRLCWLWAVTTIGLFVWGVTQALAA